MKIWFKQTTPEDKDYFWNLHKSSFKDVFLSQFGGWDDSEQYSYFESKWANGDFQGIMLNHKIIGGIIVRIYPDYHELTEIQIHPDFQNKGIGTIIIRAETEKAARKGKAIRLYVFLDSPAYNLYKRLGFRVISKSQFQYQMELSTIEQK